MKQQSFTAAAALGRRLYQRRRDHRLSVYAASSCFYLLLSLVPFLGLLVQMLRLLPDGMAQQFFTGDLMPEAVLSFVTFLIN
ncbi:MAG: hypothetical protein IJN31_07110, partial [Peptococcaceae bacterium]|nr:hypothetical protein [Peptococcaceae bacterium]